MSKLNTGTGRGPMRTEAAPSGKTHNAAPGYKRDACTELFMHAGVRFYGEDSYYEEAAVADERLRELTRSLAATDEGWAWLCGFTPYLRRKMNIRTAALAIAAEAVAYRIERRTQAYRSFPADLGILGTLMSYWDKPLTNRQLLNAVQARGDEPCELLAWALDRYERKIPVPFKRGIADGAARWDERAVLRYDKPGNTIRFADVLELCHPKPRAPRPENPMETGAGRARWAEIGGTPEWQEYHAQWQELRAADIERGRLQGILFRHLITVRRKRELGLNGEPYAPPAELKAIRARWMLNGLPVPERHEYMRAVQGGDEEKDSQFQLAMAGSWEWVRSWLGGKNDD